MAKKKKNADSTQVAESVRAAFNLNPLPASGLVRLKQIIGDPGDLSADPPIPATPAIVPVGRSSWWAGVKDGRYPKPVKIGPRTTAWRVEDIRLFLDQCSEKAA